MAFPYSTKYPNGTSKLSNPFEILEGQYNRLPENWKDDVKNYIIEPFNKQSLDALSGEFTLSISQYYNSLFSSINDESAKQIEIKGISVLSHEFWEHDPFQRQYINYNIEVAKRGHSIQRIFVMNRGIDSGIWKIIQKQLDNGIEIKVVDSKVFSQFPNLDDMVIVSKDGELRSYTSKQFFNNSNSIKSANLNLNITYCKEQLFSFQTLWKLGEPPKPSHIIKEQKSTPPPGLLMQVNDQGVEVISCEEAAMARNVPLANELKSMVINSSAGFVVVHLPGDGQISLRAVKNALEIKNARIASKEDLYELHLSPGTVSAILEPVWSMPHLISKRLLTQDYVTTNNGTRSQYFKFDPVKLLGAEQFLLGQFEK